MASINARLDNGRYKRNGQQNINNTNSPAAGSEIYNGISYEEQQRLFREDASRFRTQYRHFETPGWKPTAQTRLFK